MTESKRNTKFELPKFFELVQQVENPLTKKLYYSGLIGHLDVAVGLDTRESKLLSHFYFTKVIAGDGYFDKATGLTLIDQRPSTYLNEGLEIDLLPYTEVILSKDADGNIKKEFVDAFTKNYLIPSLENAYSLIGNEGKHYYKTGDGEVAPAVSLYELNVKNIAHYAQIENNFTKHITTDFATKSFLRSHEEYALGNLVEFVLMSFGDVVKYDGEGNEVFIAAKDNVGLVPVKARGIESLPPDATVSESERLLKPSLEINPDFIKERMFEISKNQIEVQKNKVMKNLTEEHKEIVNNPEALSRIIDEHIRKTKEEKESQTNVQE